MRCCVVGSGVTGLSAALLLARLGHEVCVVEARPRPAPILQGFVRDGLYFETGFHYGGGLHRGGVLWQWLAALGLLDGPDALHDIQLTYRDNFFFADGLRAVLPSGMDAVASGIARQFPGSEAAMRAFMDATLAIFAHSPYLGAQCRGEPYILAEGTSLTERLAQSGLPLPVQAMIASRCLSYGVLPEDASFDEFALVAGPSFQSCGGWQGGGRALAQALLARLDRLGCPVLCGQPVTAVDADSDGERNIRGVMLADGRTLPCDVCICTGHPSQLAGLVPEGLLRPAFRHRVAAMPESIHALLLFAETRDALHAGESVYLLPTANESLHFPSLLEDDPAVHIFCDRAQADGRKAVMAVAHLGDTAIPPAYDAGYAAWKCDMATRLQTHIERRLPHFAGNWRVLDAATPRTMQRFVHGHREGLYGVRHSRHEMPLLPMTRVKGLYLAGQHVLLPGILGGIVSAALAVGFAFGHDAVLKEFRQCANNG